MKIYVVGYSSAYEGGDVLAVYSSRKKAEASWQMRNAGVGDLWEITEFELDLDPDAEKQDIDRRPVYGPKTYAQHIMNEMVNRMLMSNLTAPSTFMSVRSFPERTGNTIQFFRPENGHTK